MGPGSLLRPRPQSPRQDLLEDRRLGTRLGLGSARLAAADPAQGLRRDGCGADLGGHRGPRSPPGLRLPGPSPRQRPHGGGARECDGGREPIRFRAPDQLPRVRPGTRAGTELRRARPSAPSRHPGGDPGADVGSLPRDHRGHDARRTGQHHGRPYRQPLQLPRAQLHHRCRLRLRDGELRRGDRRPGVALL